MRDPLLDQMYLRLESLIASHNETLERENAELREKLSQQETAPSVVYSIDSSILDDIRDLTAAGEKIKCIKAVRKCFGIGLKDAKDFCDKVLFKLVQ